MVLHDHRDIKFLDNFARKTEIGGSDVLNVILLMLGMVISKMACSVVLKFNSLLLCFYLQLETNSS